VYEIVNGAARGQDIHRQIFERNLAVQLLIDPETGRIVEANPAACAFYVYTREELIKRKITDINSLPVSEVHTAMGQATGERQNTFRFRHRLATGEVRDVEVHSGPIELDGRRLLYSIIHDVTESERAQAELQRTISLLQSTLDSTTDGILAIDRQGRILSYNQRFARMWRIPPEVLDSGDDDKAVAFAGEQLHAPEQFRRKIQQVYAQPDVESFDVLSQGRPGLRALLDPADARRAAGRPRLELPRRHRTPPGGSRAARVRGQLPPALREPPHADVGLRPARPPLPRGQRVGRGALRLLA
jgi:PAS domain S-box-containing protein